MPQADRLLSPYAADAVTLLGQLLRKTLIESKLRTTEVAERVEISRGLLRCMKPAIRAARSVRLLKWRQLSACSIPLRSGDQNPHSASNREVMSLIPNSVGTQRIEIDDDF
jgi:hypothetical protein